jgi:hypothetical protein
VSGVTGTGTGALAWPDGWRRELGGGKFFSLLIIGFSAFIGLSGLLLLFQGKLAGAFIVLVIAIGFGLIGFARWPRQRRGEFGTDAAVVNGLVENGLFIPMRPSTAGGFGLALTCLPFLGFGAWGAVIAYQGREWWPLFFCVFLFILGVSFLFGAISTFRVARQQVRGLLVTPQRVRLTFGDTLDLEWSEIASIDARTLSLVAEHILLPTLKNHLICFVVHDVRQVEELPRQFRNVAQRLGLNAVGTIPTDRLTVDPLRVLYALRFYLAHPEARPELATSAARDRVARAAF